MKTLELNDGWTQIPPKEDGEYWFAHAKPWHSGNAYDQDLLMLVRIKDGKRIEVMDGYDEKWIPPDSDSPDNPVWDSESQFEMLAAWRPKCDGEGFNNLPPEISGIIFERHPVECPACGRLAAIYRATDTSPWVCHSCGRDGIMEKDYFDRKFMAAFKSAIEKDTGVTWPTD